ncbi:MAG: LamG-like jellyroll fold domain-containing protein [Vicingaceae bacterium]
MKTFGQLLFLLFISISSFSQSIYFNGNSYADLGNSVANGSRTIEFWFKPDQPISPSLTNFSILMQRNTFSPYNENEFGFVFNRSGLYKAGHLRFKVHNSSGTKYEVFSDQNTWAQGQWYHVAAVIDAVTGISLYIDGKKQLDNEPNYTNSVPSSNELVGLACQGNQFNRNFKGFIDEIRFSSTARYNLNFNPSCTSVSDSVTIALFNFSVFQQNGNVNSTNSNYTALNSGGLSVTDNACPTISKSIYFDGNSYADLGNSVANGSRTIEFWFKPDQPISPSLTNFSILMQRNTFSPYNENEFGFVFNRSGLYKAGHLRFKVHNSSGTKYEVFSDQNTWTQGQWYHVAAVIDAVTGISLYIDGKKQLDNEPNYTSSVPSSNELVGLACQGNQFNRNFKGFIDEIRFSSTARYNLNFNPPCTSVSDSVTTALFNFSLFQQNGNVNSTNSNYIALNNGGLPVMDDACLTVDVLVNKKEQLDFNIYPNPTEGIVWLEFTSDDDLSKYQFSVIDIHGRAVFNNSNISTGAVKVDFSAIESGIYLINLHHQGDVIKTQKLILR